MATRVDINEEYADFRVSNAVRKVGQNVLHLLLKHSCPKLIIQTFKGYLKESTNIPFSIFDSSQKQKLQKDPSGLTFDISLLYKLLCNVSNNIAQSDTDVRWSTEGELEYYLKILKKKRNENAHRTEPIPISDLPNEILNLEEMFVNLLKASQNRFDLPAELINQEITKVKKTLNDVSLAPFTDDLINEYILNEGILEIKEMYSRLAKINPMEFFPGLECHVDVPEIFIDIEMKERLSHLEEGKGISLRNFFKLFNSKRSNVNMVIIEGLAGSGKSTLVKYFLSQWCLDSSTIIDMHDFSIIVYMQCNNSFICSLSDLFRSLMPKTARKIGEKDLVNFLLSRNLLLLIDGIDEITNSNKLVFQNLINSILGRNIRVICTTRPEKVKWIHAIKKDIPSKIIKLNGIPRHSRRCFAEKYMTHLSLSLELRSFFDIDTLYSHLERISSNLGSEVSLPLTLAMIIYLLLIEPSKAESLTCKMEVYEELVSILKEKLMSRAANYCPTKDSFELESECDEFCQVLYEEALNCLTQQSFALSEEAISRISLKSSNFGMGPQEVLSGFLVMKSTLTQRGIQNNFCFPHKGLLEFMAVKAMEKNGIGKSNRGRSINEPSHSDSRIAKTKKQLLRAPMPPKSSKDEDIPQRSSMNVHLKVMKETVLNLFKKRKLKAKPRTESLFPRNENRESLYNFHKDDIPAKAMLPRKIHLETVHDRTIKKQKRSTLPRSLRPPPPPHGISVPQTPVPRASGSTCESQRPPIMSTDLYVEESEDEGGDEEEDTNIYDNYTPDINEIIKNLLVSRPSIEEEKNQFELPENTLNFISSSLSKQNDSLTEEQMSHIIHLYEQSGINDCSQWLELLKTTKCHGSMCAYFLDKFKEILVNQSHLKTLISLFQYGVASHLRIQIDGPFDDSKCELREIFDLISGQDMMLSLILSHEFRNPGSCNSLVLQYQNIIGKGILREFCGRLDENSLLLLQEKSLEVLSLSVDSQNGIAGLHQVTQLKGIKKLHLHIVHGGISVESLPVLPSADEVELSFSSLTSKDLEWFSSAIARLNPRETLRVLRFPRSSLNMESCLRIFDLLGECGIQTDEVRVNSSALSLEDEEEIAEALANTDSSFEVFEGEVIW